MIPPRVSLVLAWAAGLALLGVASCAQAATVITARIQWTNVTSLLGGTNGQYFEVNSARRTFTNGVATPASQILAGTTIATFVQRSAIQVARFPFTNVRLVTDNISNIWLTASNDVAIAVTLSPTTWGQVSYSTNTIASSGPVMDRLDAESEFIRTNQATRTVASLRAYSLIGLGLTNSPGSNASVKPLVLPSGNEVRNLEAGNGNVSLGITSTSVVVNPSLTPAVNNLRVTNALAFKPLDMNSEATTNQLDLFGPQSLYWTNLATNVVMQITNVWGGSVSNRTIHLFFTGHGADPFNITFLCPNPAGVVFRWAGETNGLTSFTVTNGIAVEAELRVWRTNVIFATWRWMR